MRSGPHLLLVFKRDSFPDNCVYWTNENVSFGARNYECVPRVLHVECRLDKIKDIFQGFGSLESLQLQKDGGAKSKQISTNLSHCNTGASSSRCMRSYKLFLIFVRTSACETRHSYRSHLLYFTQRASFITQNVTLWHWGLLFLLHKYQIFGYESQVSRNETRSLCNKL